MKKPTTMVTNIDQLYTALHGKRCDKTHKHVHVTGAAPLGKRSKHAQIYPPKLVSVMVEAIARICRR